MIAALAGAACGSEEGGGSGSGAATADVAAAKAALAPYTGKPSAFPVEEPLAKPVPAGTTFSYLQCVTPVCGLFAEILPPAAKTLGVKLNVTKAGASADSLQNAMDAILAEDPSAVIFPAVEPDTINTKLKDLETRNIPSTSNGIMDQERFGIDGAMFNRETAELGGRLLAAWTVQRKAEKADVVFYTTPELSFGPVIEEAFAAEMKKLCAGCPVRQVDVPVGTIGNAAPSRVVSDLQANPDTNVAVFSTQEAAVGLPAALKTAGLDGKVDVTGFAPNPAVLQDMKTGGIASGLGLDVGTMIWTQVDEAARLANGEPLTELEQRGIPPMQMLERKDVQDMDVSKGWTGYPDFPARFAKLWGGGS